MSTAAKVVTILGSQHGRYGEQGTQPEQRTLSSATDVDDLERYVRRRIESANTDGTLWVAPGLTRILFDWRRVGGDAEMRMAVGKWASEATNLSALLSTLTATSSHGQTKIDLQTVSLLLDVDDVAVRAKAALESTATAARVRTIWQTFVNAYEPFEARRKEERTQLKIFTGVLDEIDKTDWFPDSHTVRTMFENERSVIDQLLNEKLIASIGSDQYMLPVEGLRVAQSDARAAFEIRNTARLLSELQKRYRQAQNVLVEFEELASQMDPAITAEQLRRAAMVLQRITNQPSIALNIATDQETGKPKSMRMADGILSFSAEDILRKTIDRSL